MTRQLIQSLFLDSNWRRYHVEIARELGLYAAIFIADLIDRDAYHTTRGELIHLDGFEGDWFYYTVEKCEERTALTRKNQDAAIKILEKAQFAQKEVKGVPPKRYFQLNYEEISKFLNKDLATILSERDKLNCPNGTNRSVPMGQIATREKPPVHIDEPISMNPKEENGRGATEGPSDLAFGAQEWAKDDIWRVLVKHPVTEGQVNFLWEKLREARCPITDLGSWCVKMLMDLKKGQSKAHECRFKPRQDDSVSTPDPKPSAQKKPCSGAQSDPRVNLGDLSAAVIWAAQVRLNHNNLSEQELIDLWKKRKKAPDQDASNNSEKT